jgi:PAS domain S-box-containing protein
MLRLEVQQLTSRSERETCYDGDLSPERFETVLSSISDGVFAVDRSRKITCFNRAAEESLGIPRARAIGAACHDLLGTKVIHDACPLCFTIETGQPIVNLPIELRDAQDRRIPVTISTAVIRGEDGEVKGGVVTFRDLTLVRKLIKNLDRGDPFQDFISADATIKHLFDILPTIAESESNVLIEGETGTGKSLLARILHRLSGRRDAPIVTINCGAMPETLLESELFGYRAGAFTGATRDRAGRIAVAEGGTLLLDEIGDLPLSMQVKLLRVIQDRVYERLGSVESLEADVRIVAATNRDLQQRVEDGAFRRDLYYRINVIRLALPPLRERVGDVPLLAQHFLRELSMTRGKVITQVSREALEALSSYHYPGNVRELQNIIEHAFVLSPGSAIEREHLPDFLKVKSETRTTPEGTDHLKKLEADYLVKVLEEHGWNRTAAAAALGIHKTTLLRKVGRLGIELPRIDGRRRSRS